MLRGQTVFLHRHLLRDIPIATDADWLGFIVDDLAHHRARVPTVTRYVRLTPVAPCPTNAGPTPPAFIAAVTTRRLFDGEGLLLQVT
jgi:hypothetical protein